MLGDSHRGCVQMVYTFDCTLQALEIQNPVTKMGILWKANSVLLLKDGRNGLPLFLIYTGRINFPSFMNILHIVFNCSWTSALYSLNVIPKSYLLKLIHKHNRIFRCKGSFIIARQQESNMLLTKWVIGFPKIPSYYLFKNIRKNKTKMRTIGTNITLRSEAGNYLESKSLINSISLLI